MIVIVSDNNLLHRQTDLEAAYIHPNFMPHETALFKQDAGVEYKKYSDLKTQQELCDIMETSCIDWYSFFAF